MATTLDLDHLRTLMAISECGGFSRAASALHISQPALSAHVRLLERHLGRKLFERNGRGMKLTPDGEEVLAEARGILAVHDQALDRLRVRATRSVVVGFTEYSASELLPTTMRMLAGAFPDVNTRFEIARSTKLAEAVEKGTVDLAYVLIPDGAGGGRELTRLELNWFAGSRVAPAIGPDAPLPLVAFAEPCGLRQRALAALSAAGRRVRVAGQSSSLEGVLAGVRAGLGVALLPNVGGAPEGLTTVRDLPEVGTAGLHLLTRKGLDPRLRRIAEDAHPAVNPRTHGLGLAG